MNDLRRRRMLVLLFLFCGGSLTATLAIFALQSNINHYYPPDEVVAGSVPIDQTIRAGGMVVIDSVVHDDTGLGVDFELSDRKGSTFSVSYKGLLPSLFREVQGAIVVGKLQSDGVFKANQVMAKHDENYVPPELKKLHEIDDS